jgi:3-oxoacyl-[acyl-carrier-protein] synthase II
LNTDNHTAWITGIGVLGPQGTGWEALCQSLLHPKVQFSNVPSAWLGVHGTPDAYIAPLNEAAEADAKRYETMSTDRACALGLAAADQAWAQAALETSTTTDPYRCGVYWGTGMGGLHTTELAYNRLLVDKQALRPMTVVRIMANAAAAQLAMKYKLRGSNHTYTVACASSAMALGEALLAIRTGRIDLAVVGGSEAMLAPGVLAAWGALRVLSTRKTAASADLACRPFATGRTGLVMGEGAAAFILESPRHAKARGVKPLAELVGYGSTCDASSLVQPQKAGQIHAMHQAIADAGLTPAHIGSINAHATGTDAGDLVEAESIAATFGATHRPPISATKSMHGHLLGAAGALEAAVCVASLHLHIAPATLGVHPLDPRCSALDVVLDTPRAMPGLDCVMSNSFAFGGSNVSLVFKRSI